MTTEGEPFHDVFLPVVEEEENNVSPTEKKGEKRKKKKEKENVDAVEGGAQRRRRDGVVVVPSPSPLLAVESPTIVPPAEREWEEAMVVQAWRRAPLVGSPALVPGETAAAEDVPNVPQGSYGMSWW